VGSIVRGRPSIVESGRGVYRLIKDVPRPETSDGIKELERKPKED